MLSDCDFPLIRKFQDNNHDVDYIISLLKSRRTGGLFNFTTENRENDIVKAKCFNELKAYSEYINIDKINILNRVYSGLHPLTFWLYIKLIFYIFKKKPDVIHITAPLWGAAMLLYVFSKKMVMTVHDPFIHSGESNRVTRWSRKIAFRLVPKLVLLNEKQKKDFIQHYKLPREKVYINSLGVYDCLKVTESPNNISGIKNYILFFGRISPYKGIDVLCEAMKLVHEKKPDIHCVIAGGGKLYFDYSPYENLPYIHLLNHFIDTPELGELIKGSLFTVCPYKDATQSGVVYSSLAYNKPIIASNVGALGDAVIDGKTGILVKPNDTKELAEAIVKLAGQEDLLSKMSAEISEVFVDGRQSWNVIANKYIAIYKD